MKTGYELIEEHDLIGVPFEFGGRDPKGTLDCYGLIMAMYQWRGIILPDYISPKDGDEVSKLITSELRLWEKTNQRQDGTMLLFVVANYLHVGFALGDGRFVHTWDGSGGVTIEEVAEWQGRLIGMYEYVG